MILYNIFLKMIIILVIKIAIIKVDINNKKKIFYTFYYTLYEFLKLYIFKYFFYIIF